jgi:hypothetical protein
MDRFRWARLSLVNRWGRALTRALGVCLLAATSLAGTVGAQGERVLSEEAVKAAYLVKFRNYVEWPTAAAQASAGKTVIGVVGADDMVEHLMAMGTPRNGTLLVRRLRIGDPLDGLQILYIDAEHWRKASAMAAQANASGVLLVTESPNALAAGSVINFRKADDRLRFEISLDAADQAGFKLSSQLLALALTVVKERRK